MTARNVLTKNQQSVLEKLEVANAPLSAYTLLDQLRERGFRAPLQVYRALDTLMKEGYVHRLESLNAFVACAHPAESCCRHGTVAFTICNSCGHVDEFHDHEVDHRLEAFTKARRFKPEKTTIEIRGLCAACAA